MPPSTTSTKPGVGGVLQLNMIGMQDTHLYQTSDTSEGGHRFFDQRWTQSTRFATVQKTVPSALPFGLTTKVVIPKRGDLLGNLALSITLPAIPGASIDDYWRERVGYILLRKLRIILNDVELDSSERLWLSLQDDLFIQKSKKAGVDDMIGRAGMRLSEEHTIVVPLKFFCCYKPGQRQTFLPLLSNTGQNSLVLEMELESFANCVTSYDGKFAPKDLAADLIADYVFLDEEDKNEIINRETPLLCEVVQDCEATSFRETLDGVGGDTIIPTGMVRVDLSEVNFPVKLIVFVAYSVDAVTQGKYFQYEDVIDTASLKFDGWERTQYQTADLYSLVQTWHHTPNCIKDHVYVYSFAMDAANSQPNGHFTFSHVRKPLLYVTLKQPRDDIVVKAFLLGYRYVNFRGGDAQVSYI
jgi:hypothetical protein